MINFYTEDTTFFYHGRELTRIWLKSVAQSESRSIGSINIIFCSDAYILDMNNRYIGHNYYTDVITFDYSTSKCISGDIFISIDTVKDNSIFYQSGFKNELHRVIVHGILHLLGYDDHSSDDILLMRSKENQYLSIRPNKLYE